MDKRAKKRWDREHRKRSLLSRLPFLGGRDSSSGQWVFHHAQWGDLTVSVMPRSDLQQNRVVDSNTGVVVKAPHHRSLLAAVVVNNGRAPDCDLPPLNKIICGDSKQHWSKHGHAWTIPTRRNEERGPIYQQAVEAVMKGQRMSREEAEGLTDQILGWAPDTMPCVECELTIPGLGSLEVVRQARAFGWMVVDTPQGPRGICPTHDRTDTRPMFTDAEVEASEGERGDSQPVA